MGWVVMGGGGFSLKRRRLLDSVMAVAPGGSAARFVGDSVFPMVAGCRTDAGETRERAVSCGIDFDTGVGRIAAELGGLAAALKSPCPINFRLYQHVYQTYQYVQRRTNYGPHTSCTWPPRWLEISLFRSCSFDEVEIGSPDTVQRVVPFLPDERLLDPASKLRYASYLCQFFPLISDVIWLLLPQITSYLGDIRVGNIWVFLKDFRGPMSAVQNKG